MPLLSRLTLLASSLAFFLAAMPVSAQEVAAPLRAIYDEGCWTLPGYASASVGDEAGEVYQVRIGGERHWAHGMALEVSGVVGHVDGFGTAVARSATTTATRRGPSHRSGRLRYGNGA